MTTATHGDYGNARRRPISVADLLRREGQSSVARELQSRRTLGGVTAGAVLAFGAVIGGLTLQHPSAAVPAGGGNTALGSGGGSPYAGAAAQSPGTADSSNTPANSTVSVASSVVPVADETTTPSISVHSHPAHTGGGATYSAPKAATPPAKVVVAPTDSAASSSPANSSSGATSSRSSSSAPTGSSTTTSNPGLIGGVGNVLDGLLHPVTGLLGG